MCNVNMCELCQGIMPAAQAKENAAAKQEKNLHKFIQKVNDCIDLWSKRGKHSCSVYFEEIEPFSRPNIEQQQLVCEMLRRKGYVTSFVHGKDKRLEIYWD